MISHASPARLTHLFLLLGLSIFGGCLKGEVHEAMTYNAERDSFRFLQLYTHIGGNNAAQLEHLGKLLKNRAHIIFLPQGLPFLSSFPALLRLPENQYKRFPLGDIITEEPATESTEIDLSQIVISPGEMFVSGDDTLCAYQVIEVPGAIVDAILARQSKSLGDHVIAKVSEELARRKRDDRLGSWDELRISNFNKLFRSTVPQTEAKTDPNDVGRPEVHYPYSCLEEASLRMLLKSAADEQLQIERKGSRFAIAFPLSATDRQQAKATIESLRDAARGHLDKDPNMSDAAKSVARSIAATALDSGKLSCSVELGTYFCLGSDKAVAGSVDPKGTVVYRSTIAAMEGRGVTVRRDLQISQIWKDFADKP